MLIHSVSSANALKARYLSSVGLVAQEEWDRLFPGASEGWGYLQACERSASDVFSLSAMGIFADDQLVAAVPLFEMDYRLDTSFPNYLQGLTAFIEQQAPRLVRVPLLAMGSPFSEECKIGFDPNLCDVTRRTALHLLIYGLRDIAREKGISLTSVKDLPEQDSLWMDEIFRYHGFARFASLPVANLDLPFETLDDYISSLSPNMRKDLKRKINQSKSVSVEVCDGIEDIEDEIIALYRQTQGNRKTTYEDFDVVPDCYFAQVMAGAQPHAKVMVYRVEGMMVGFSLMLEEQNRVIGKFVGLNYALSRKYNVYFVNWLETVRYCLERGIPRLQTGQTTYALKAKMGCTLTRSWIYFNYAGAFWGPVFRMAGSRLALDATDPDLKKLGVDAPYVA